MIITTLSYWILPINCPYKKLLAVTPTLLFLGTFLISNDSLLADRLHLENGTVLRGKIVNVNPKQYKFQNSDGSIVEVNKLEVKQAMFSATGLEEIGYIDFFVRMSIGTGRAVYEEESSQQLTGNTDPLPTEASHSPLNTLRIGVQPGWVMYNNNCSSLALHSGFEYHLSGPLKIDDLNYSYLSLIIGLSYYFSPWNIYISPQMRLPLFGSVSTHLESSFDGGPRQDEKANIQEDGLGFGFSVGKEWLTQENFIWGLALSYSEDYLSLDRSSQGENSHLPAIVDY